MQTNKNVILLTGGTSGIGLEMVRQFYELENKLIVTSSKQANLDNLKKQFPKHYDYSVRLGRQLLCSQSN